MTNFEAFTPEAVCEFLRKEIPSISEDVLKTFIEHKVDGEVFLEFNDEYLREVAPILGDRIKIKRALRVAQNLSLPAATIPEVSSNRCIDHTLSHDTTSVTSCSTSFNCSILSVDEVYSCSSEDEDQPPSNTVKMDAKVDSKEVKQEVTASSKEVKQEATTSRTDQPLPGWAEKLIIPSRFSKETTLSIQSGIPTRKARDEIINSLATLIMVHTMKPSSGDFKTICTNLICKYPILKDKEGSGSGIDSWKKKLIMKFKNLRRPERKQRLGVSDDISPPLKKKKVDSPSKKSSSAVTATDSSSSDMATYEQNISYLQKNYRSHKYSISTISLLLEETRTLRRKWISQENPSVKSILEKFPCFQEPNFILLEFSKLKGIDIKNMATRWDFMEECVLSYCKQDSRRAINSILTQFNSIKETTTDQTTTYVVLLLQNLLVSRGKKKCDFMVVFEGECLDIEECIESVECNAPIVAAFGESTKNLTDIKVIIEKENILTMPSIKVAVQCCFASYFMYNISYPTNISPFLLFLEYVYCVPHSQKLPVTVSVIIDSLEKIQSQNK